MTVEAYQRTPEDGKGRQRAVDDQRTVKDARGRQRTPEDARGRQRTPEAYQRLTRGLPDGALVSLYA